MSTIEALLKDNARAVEMALCARCESVPTLRPLADDAALEELVRAQDYSLMAGGKRIRPTLVLQTCHMLGGERQAAMPFACAVEMIHTYSLIHDDLPCMDDDDLRRGKPTNHRVFGEATATLAGDGLLTDAFSVLAAHTGASEANRLEAIRVLAAAAGSAGMVGGQIMDMRGQNERLPLDTLKSLHARKTGAMIRASVALGALAAGVMPTDAPWEALMDYADRIGLAFQVVDDVLDVTADVSTLGKSIGKDQRDDKTTFLSYYTVEEAKQVARTLTEQACEAVKDMDRDGVLCALARYLAERVY